MHDAIAELVRDGDAVAIEGFTHLISFAAGARDHPPAQARPDACPLTPDLIYDQMIAAGVARKLVFSWLGQPGRRRARRYPATNRRGVRRSRSRSRSTATSGWSAPHNRRSIEVACRSPAAQLSPPSRPPVADPRRHRPAIQTPPTARIRSTMPPPLRPDVAIVHAQRASAHGDTQGRAPARLPKRGCVGRREAGHRACRSRKLVDEAVIRLTRTRTTYPLGPDRRNAVVVEPWGAHPSITSRACYDRDNRFYLDWDACTPATRRRSRPGSCEWVFDLDGRGRPGGHRAAAKGRGPASTGSAPSLGIGRLRGVPTDGDRCEAHDAVEQGRACGTVATRHSRPTSRR